MDMKVSKQVAVVDEVDFISTSASSTTKKEICVSCKSIKGFLMRNSTNAFNNNNHTPKTPTSTKKTSVYGDCEIQTAVKSHISALERLHLFNFPTLRKKNGETPEKLSTKEHRQRLIKSTSFVRLFGNTYSTRKSEEHNSNISFKKSISVSEKFSSKSSESDDEFAFRMSEQQMNLNEISSIHGSLDSSEDSIEKSNLKTIRNFTKNLGKLLRRNSDSLTISTPDPEYKVFYLGNVLTGWAKGDACIEKPLATLWRNYTQNNKPEVLMRLRVCPSGLKATTRQHGLTEYWSHRISFCSTPRSHPKIFCWIYRHEGKKLKHELRCHAVICAKDVQCLEMATILKQNLTIALREFKRDKINKQNARLSLANAADENPSMPRRKILLSTGGNNYRPPLERSKSAPKLFAIEEMVDEEDEECDDETKAKKKNEKEDIKQCCKEDYLYPSVTLGRRRCRRGHSIRKSRLLRGSILSQKSDPIPLMKKLTFEENKESALTNDLIVSSLPVQEFLTSDEDFESFLLYNNYDSTEPLAGDLLAYFDLKLQSPSNSKSMAAATLSMSDLHDDEILLKDQRNSMSMTDLVDYQSEIELDYTELETNSDIHFNQDTILANLRRRSRSSLGETGENSQHQSFIHEVNNSTDSYDANVIQCHNEYIFNKQNQETFRPTTYFEDESPSSLCSSEKTVCLNLDSDESSISSGCETLSTVTTNTEDIIHLRRGSVLDRVRNFEQLAESKVTRKPLERCSSATFCLKNANNNNIESIDSNLPKKGTLTRLQSGNITKKSRDDDSDELSDESGYVEFQDLSLKSSFA